MVEQKHNQLVKISNDNKNNLNLKLKDLSRQKEEIDLEVKKGCDLNETLEDVQRQLDDARKTNVTLSKQFDTEQSKLQKFLKESNEKSKMLENEKIAMKLELETLKNKYDEEMNSFKN